MTTMPATPNRSLEWTSTSWPLSANVGHPMPRLLAACSLVLCVCGCSTCYTQTYLEPAVASSNQRFEVETSRDRIVLKASGTASLSLGPCVLGSNAVSGTLCAYLRVAEGKKARFRETYFTSIDVRTGTSSMLKFDRFNYVIACRVAANGVKSCSSPEQSPVEGQIQSEELRRSTYLGVENYIKRVSFDASMEFVGAWGKEGAPAWRLFDEAENWREYTAIVSTQPLLGSELTLTIPVLLIDGSEIRFPQVRLSTVTKEVCYRPNV